MTEVPIKNLYSQWVDSEWAVIFPPSNKKSLAPALSSTMNTGSKTTGGTQHERKLDGNQNYGACG